MSKIIVSSDAEQTEAIAKRIGLRLRGSEVIELMADLGGGKTTFARGLVGGIESTDHVSSPSFTISNEYQGKKIRLVHFDFYRLEQAGLIEDSLIEFLGRPDTAVVVEWSDIIKHVLPTKRLSINFKVLGEDTRELKLTYPSTLEYLVEGL